MTSIAPTQCRACARFRSALGAGCEAFTEGRPDSIRFYGADHRTAVPGDTGKAFVLDAGTVAAQALHEWQSTFG